MPSRKHSVLLTGAAGYVAAQLLPEFTHRYGLRLVDVRDTDRRGRPVPDIAIADLTNADRSQYAALFEGIDAVVHLGYRSPATGPGAEETPELDRFDSEFANVRMAQNVYRCAYDAGVPRVVMASSNHAADWYEHNLIHRRKMETVHPDDVPLSDNFYGWAKASYELLGFVYATGAFGRKLEVVQVRIGAPREIVREERDPAAGPGHVGSPGAPAALATYKRQLGAYISQRDLCQLFARAVETPDISNRHGVPWLVVYGISDNTRAFWSLETARRVLGYRPEDDSEAKFADDIRRVLTGPDAAAPGGRLGT